jgi:hypothetical protein
MKLWPQWQETLIGMVVQFPLSRAKKTEVWSPESGGWRKTNTHEPPITDCRPLRLVILHADGNKLNS